MFCDTRGERDVATVEIVVLAHGVAGMHADADADGTVGVVAKLGPDRPLDRERALGCAAGAWQRDHEAIALRLDLEAALLAHLAANDRVVHAQQLEPTHIPDARVELG